MLNKDNCILAQMAIMFSCAIPFMLFGRRHNEEYQSKIIVKLGPVGQRKMSLEVFFLSLPLVVIMFRRTIPFMYM